MVGLQSETVKRGLRGAMLLAASLLFSPPAAAQAPAAAACTKAEFETVVDEAAASLRDLNLKNRPAFQEKLGELKTRRGWTQDEFVKEAAPFVKDSEIEVYDQKSNELLAKISSMGQEGSTAKTPDCALLAELHGHMSALVEAQTAKWAYMFGKLEMELAK